MIKVDSLESFFAAPDADYCLSGHDGKIFAYAKNCYNTIGDMILDLKIIIGKTCGVDPEKVSYKFIYTIVYHVFVKWVEIKNQQFVWRNLFEGVVFFKESVKFKEVISLMLLQISLIQMKYPNKELHFGDIGQINLSEY